MRPLATLFLAALLVPDAALAQGRGICVSATALQLQPILVVPEPQGGFSYRLQVYNNGGGSRSFSYHFPLALLMPPAGAVYAFNIRPRQTITIELGTTQQRASDETLRNTLRITCHN